MRGRVGELWARLREREYLDGDGGGGTAARVVQIVDVSPVVLTALLAATPSIDLSYLVAFMERHLKFSNWARASLLKFGDLSWSSYTFEYHFSFFYVTGEAHDTKSARPDPRSIRRSAPFGIDPSGETKYIHEETRSLLLIGHFSDVLTCVQLADAYFKYDPYQRPTPEDHAFRTYNPAEPPALLLLSWIAVTLHHVCWRWQSAIDTVHDEITSAGEIVFMADRSDLMADDPHFSLSKRYFWALQAYKLFEETIAETITTWADFKAHSLPKLHHHPGISPAAWARSIADIDSAHTQLSRKITRLQKHRAEIKDLRRGLISASALFDSRTAVRQGENIRLLTYITILFFPLSFATDLFGMQWIPSGRATWHAFAAVLPAIFLATALFVFNLSTLSDAASTLAEAFSNALRDRMRACPHTVWPARAARLTRHAAQAKPPVRKARHTAVGWVYALFLLEGTAVALPRGEIAALVQHFRSPRPRSRTNGEKDADVGPVSPTGEGRGARSARDKVLLSLAQAQREEEAAPWRRRGEDNGRQREVTTREGTTRERAGKEGAT
ncbi:hypothetical protein EJ06DRAFT_475641 [Trichodelitschia bisporula]|uniref:Cora-domain-containing protein n=1 Tax=Trichodelitschia bisporula TaxID=703511 RepID=A0A6G1HZ12_9PEZI|nr:hypothetical protein EJ06DRAFT_475641 [Trichodelitschia bisporula]